jgi:hypothetical protein
MLLLGSVLVLPTRALAISAPIHIANTGGEGVFIRPEPNTSRPAIGWMPEGASPDYHCFAWGQNVNGVPIWFNVTYNGVTGFYASYFDDSSYHSNEELTAKYGVPLCGASPPPASSPPTQSPAPPPAAAPDGGGVYSIMDAAGGVYFRKSPSWGDASSTPGEGVYDGDQVRLICGAFGEAYGPYSNRWWSYVQNLTRPSAGQGWVNAHFINDGMPANQPSPGEGNCPPSIPGAPGGGGSQPSAQMRSVFFWPDGVPASMQVADSDFEASAWYSRKGCNPVFPAPILLPGSVNTLAGWSSGRLGPMYFLHLFPQQWSQIHTIILFDPGNLENMSDPNPNAGCDSKLKKPSITQMLASWLKQPDNELLVLTGAVSEEKPIAFRIPGTSIEVFAGKPQFHGLWNYYFHDLWQTDMGSRAIVCDYDNLGHEAVLTLFAQIVKSTGLGFRPAGCPVSSQAALPVRWSP